MKTFDSIDSAFVLGMDDALFSSFTASGGRQVGALDELDSASSTYAVVSSVVESLMSSGAIRLKPAGIKSQAQAEDDARWAPDSLAFGAGEGTFEVLTATRTVVNTTSVGKSGNFTNKDINGLLSGIAWDATELTFSFPTAASNYGAAYGDQNAVSGFQVLSAEQQAVFRYALDLISQYTGMTFTEITETDAVHATLRFAGSNAPSTSYAYYPSTNDLGGDIWLGNIRDTVPTKAGYAFDTILHEIGHAMGLKHGHTNDGVHGKLPAEHDSTEWSLMSYHSYVGADEFYRNRDGSGNQSYMINDIAALQYIYGANFNANGGATVYSWSATTGEMFINGVGQGAATTNTIYQAIWDGNGKDTYDLSNYSSDLTIDLRPGEWSTFMEAQLPYLNGSDLSIRSPGNISNAHLFDNDARSYIENAIGGRGNDSITGNDTANGLTGGKGGDDLAGLGGKDRLNGGKGSDVLAGGAGADELTGAAGADRFAYELVSDSSAGAGRDVILDFSQAQGDRIDLRDMDADATLAGQQVFSFVAGGFTGAAGQLIQYNDGSGHTILAGDVNGDSVADFEIQLNGAPVLVSGDLLLGAAAPAEPVRVVLAGSPSAFAPDLRAGDYHF